MNNISKIKEALLNDTQLQQYFIQALIDFEKNGGYPGTNIRDSVSGPLADELFLGEKFSKELQNGLKINFVYNSKIAREFLLSQPAIPDHVWEPQTTKLLMHFSGKAENVIIAGAYFGDQAIPVAYNIKGKGICHAFEPNKNNADLIIENARLNGLTNLLVNNVALWNKSNEKLVFDGEDALASTITANEATENILHTITINDYASQNNLSPVNLLMIDVEGSELKVLEGATEVLQKDKPVVVFETHSLYNDWSSGLENSDSVKFMTGLGYEVYAIREFHQNIDTGNMPVELLPLNSTFCEVPPHHGFNLLAIPAKHFTEDPLFKIVYHLSPKLLLHKNDNKFLPSKF